MSPWFLIFEQEILIYNFMLNIFLQYPLLKGRWYLDHFADIGLENSVNIATNDPIMLMLHDDWLTEEKQFLKSHSDTWTSAIFPHFLWISSIWIKFIILLFKCCASYKLFWVITLSRFDTAYVATFTISILNVTKERRF
jgi:hypothetical protein